MKKIIVTGADGLIGRYIVEELQNRNHLVYAIIRDHDKAKKTLPIEDNIKILQYSMDKYCSLVSEKELFGADAIIHMAWSGVSNTTYQNYEDQLNNVRYSCDLMESAIELKVKKFIYAGSLMEYEHQKAYNCGFYNVPLRNVYHVAKTAARNMLQIIANNKNIGFCTVTISNVYGVGEKTNRLINTAARKMLNGEHMGFTPAEQMYDFIYVEDAARAICEVTEKGKNNKNYYIGNQIQKPLKEFLIEMRNIINPELQLGIGELPYRGISLDYTELDTQGLYEDFGFIPKYSFSEGIYKTIKWLKEEENAEI